MALGIPNSPQRGSGGFQKVVDVFLAGEGLPFAHVLSAERIKRIFDKHGCRFGLHGIYTASLMVWSFLSQVLRDGKEASCQAAVARVVSYCEQEEIAAPTEDTGDYCRARAKLAVAALRELSGEVAGELEQAADPAWLWKGQYHAKLIDGFTFTMPDTPKNQAEYPQAKSQAPGVGLPIALMFGQGTQVCARKHQGRHSDFRRGRRLGKYDHVIVWTRPQRPTWMDAETYARIPETLVLREIRFSIVEPGRRTHTIDIITTLVDADEYTKQDIAELYGFRWNAELDLRSIKSNLNLGHVRCKSPEMVHRELWTTLLGYNLIRMTAAGAALVHEKQPRQISFTSACQYVLASWMQLSGGLIQPALLDGYLRRMLKQIAACEVAHRPGRLEPRVLKRRRPGYKLMQQPRSELRRELRQRCT